MALSAAGNFVVEDGNSPGGNSMVVLAAAVIFNTALCSHTTTSGEIKPFDGTQTDKLVGWHFGDNVTGAAAATNEGRPRARINPGGFTVKDLAVATLANDLTDLGKQVFATDDGTYTITDPISGQVVGHVVDNADSPAGFANVRMRDLSQLAL